MPCVDSPVTCKIRSSTTTRTIKGDMQDWKLLGMQTEHINVLPVVPGICRFSINMQGTAMQEYLWSYTTVIQDRYTRFWGCLVNLTGKTCWGRADDVLTKCWGAKHDHIYDIYFLLRNINAALWIFRSVIKEHLEILPVFCYVGLLLIYETEPNNHCLRFQSREGVKDAEDP